MNIYEHVHTHAHIYISINIDCTIIDHTTSTQKSIQIIVFILLNTVRGLVDP